MVDTTGKQSPKISVIMGIYNCEATLSEAIDCILQQTETDWELILCEDGSSDGTYAVAKRYQEQYPDKIVLLKNEKNQGLNATLNRCLKAARGTFIARMDGDDRCAPERFAVELRELEEHPELAIVSTNMDFFDESGVWGQVEHPEYPDKRDFVHGSPFCHAPCLVRKSAYDLVQGYSEGKLLLRVEDYHLWLKMYAAGLKGKNIHQSLYQMRDDRNAYSRRKFRYRVNEAYVRGLAVIRLKLPIWNLVYALRPIIVGLLPNVIYDRLHKQKLLRK